LAHQRDVFAQRSRAFAWTLPTTHGRSPKEHDSDY